MEWEIHRLDMVFRLAVMDERGSFGGQGVGQKGILGREKNLHQMLRGKVLDTK